MASSITSICRSEPSHQLHFRRKRTSPTYGDAGYDNVSICEIQSRSYPSATKRKAYEVLLLRPRNFPHAYQQAPVSSKTFFRPPKARLQNNALRFLDIIPADIPPRPKQFSDNHSIRANTTYDTGFASAVNDQVNISSKKFSPTDLSALPFKDHEGFSKPATLVSDVEPIKTISSRRKSDFTFYDGGRGSIFELMPVNYYGANQKDKTVAEAQITSAEVLSQTRKPLQSNKYKVTSDSCATDFVKDYDDYELSFEKTDLNESDNDDLFSSSNDFDDSSKRCSYIEKEDELQTSSLPSNNGYKKARRMSAVTNITQKPFSSLLLKEVSKQASKNTFGVTEVVSKTFLSKSNHGSRKASIFSNDSEVSTKTPPLLHSKPSLSSIKQKGKKFGRSSLDTDVLTKLSTTLRSKEGSKRSSRSFLVEEATIQSTPRFTADRNQLPIQTSTQTFTSKNSLEMERSSSFDENSLSLKSKNHDEAESTFEEIELTETDDDELRSNSNVFDAFTKRRSYAGKELRNPSATLAREENRQKPISDKLMPMNEGVNHNDDQDLVFINQPKNDALNMKSSSKSFDSGQQPESSESKNSKTSFLMSNNGFKTIKWSKLKNNVDQNITSPLESRAELTSKTSFGIIDSSSKTSPLDASYVFKKNSSFSNDFSLSANTQSPLDSKDSLSSYKHTMKTSGSSSLDTDIGKKLSTPLRSKEELKNASQSFLVDEAEAKSSYQDISTDADVVKKVSTPFRSKKGSKKSSRSSLAEEAATKTSSQLSTDANVVKKLSTPFDLKEGSKRESRSSFAGETFISKLTSELNRSFLSDQNALSHESKGYDETEPVYQEIESTETPDEKLNSDSDDLGTFKEIRSDVKKEDILQQRSLLNLDENRRQPKDNRLMSMDGGVNRNDDQDFGIMSKAKNDALNMKSRSRSFDRDQHPESTKTENVASKIPLSLPNNDLKKAKRSSLEAKIVEQISSLLKLYVESKKTSKTSFGITKVKAKTSSSDSFHASKKSSLFFQDHKDSTKTEFPLQSEDSRSSNKHKTKRSSRFSLDTDAVKDLSSPLRSREGSKRASRSSLKEKASIQNISNFAANQSISPDQTTAETYIPKRNSELKRISVSDEDSLSNKSKGNDGVKRTVEENDLTETDDDVLDAFKKRQNYIGSEDELQQLSVLKQGENCRKLRDNKFMSMDGGVYRNDDNDFTIMSKAKDDVLNLRLRSKSFNADWQPESTKSGKFFSKNLFSLVNNSLKNVRRSSHGGNIVQKIFSSLESHADPEQRSKTSFRRNENVSKTSSEVGHNSKHSIIFSQDSNVSTKTQISLHANDSLSSSKHTMKTSGRSSLDTDVAKKSSKTLPLNEGLKKASQSALSDETTTNTSSQRISTDADVIPKLSTPFRSKEGSKRVSRSTLATETFIPKQTSEAQQTTSFDENSLSFKSKGYDEAESTFEEDELTEADNDEFRFNRNDFDSFTKRRSYVGKETKLQQLTTLEEQENRQHSRYYKHMSINGGVDRNDDSDFAIMSKAKNDALNLKSRSKSFDDDLQPKLIKSGKLVSNTLSSLPNYSQSLSPLDSLAESKKASKTSLGGTEVLSKTSPISSNHSSQKSSSFSLDPVALAKKDFSVHSKISSIKDNTKRSNTSAVDTDVLTKSSTHIHSKNKSKRASQSSLADENEVNSSSSKLSSKEFSHLLKGLFNQVESIVQKEAKQENETEQLDSLAESKKASKTSLGGTEVLSKTSSISSNHSSQKSSSFSLDPVALAKKVSSLHSKISSIKDNMKRSGTSAVDTDVLTKSSTHIRSKNKSKRASQSSLVDKDEANTSSTKLSSKEFSHLLKGLFDQVENIVQKEVQQENETEPELSEVSGKESEEESTLTLQGHDIPVINTAQQSRVEKHQFRGK